MATNRTILSVIEVTPDVGEPFLYIEWHPEVMGRVDPDGKDTDAILGLIEEILAPVDDDHERDRDEALDSIGWFG